MNKPQNYHAILEIHITRLKSRTLQHPLLLRGVFCFLVASLLSLLIPASSVGNDYGCVYLASSNMLHGQSPYAVACYIYPIWLAIAAMPLALLPAALSYHVYLVLAIGAILFVALSARRRWLAVLCCVPLIVLTLLWGNVDWILLVGFVLPFPAAMPLLLIKPQIGAVLAAMLTWQAWRAGQRWSVVSWCAVLAIWFAASISAGMSWSGASSGAWYVGQNLSVWPLGAFLGVPLAVVAFRRCNRVLAVLACVLCAPYVGGTFPALFVAMVGVNRTRTRTEP